MGNFVQIRDQDGDVDYVNRDAIARVHAERISAQEWVVKVVLVGGLEVLDSRSQDKDVAAARVAAIVGASV